MPQFPVQNDAAGLLSVLKNMSGSKKERIVYDSDCDRLSELPSSIIRCILSSVSTRDAVRMSVLSRQFRYKWISLPHLVFDLSEFSSKECMEKFVTNVLKLHKGPIHKFGMFAVLEQSWPIVDEWLIFLPKNNIRELILTLGFEGRIWHEVRFIAYSCNKLTHLELRECRLGPPPLTFTGFLFLRRLILVLVIISLNDVQSIVANSPLLETLKVDRCCSYDRSPVLRISAPNMKDLYLQSEKGDCMELYLCAPLLTEIFVEMNDEDGAIEAYLDLLQQQNRSICNYTNFLGGCTSLEKLRGDMFFITILSFGIDSCRDSFVLHSLKAVELNYVNFGYDKEMSVVVRLLTDAPNLQKLTIRFSNFAGSWDEEDEPDLSFMKCLRAPNFKWEKLKIINMIDVAYLPSEIEFFKLLLKNSPALERMTLRIEYELDSDEEKDLREELLNCDFSSPKFTLFIDHVRP